MYATRASVAMATYLVSVVDELPASRPSGQREQRSSKQGRAPFPPSTIQPLEQLPRKHEAH